MAMVDVAVVVMEDVAMAEAKATEAMAPGIAKVCAVHLEQTSSIMAPGMWQTRCAHPGIRLVSALELSVETTSPMS